MENNQRNSRKRLNSLILLVAFTAVMLIVSTYAWFSTQRNVTLSGIHGEVNVAEGLQVSLDGATWVNSINFNDFDQTESGGWKQSATASQNYFQASVAADNPTFLRPLGSTSTLIQNTVPSEFLPISTTGLDSTNDGIGETSLKFYKGTLKEGFSKLDTIKPVVDNDNPESATSGYFAFDLFVQNTSASTVKIDKLQLDANSVVSADNDTFGTQNTARVAFALYNNDAADMEISGSNDKADSAVEIVGGTSTGKTIKDIAIWEPNADNHKASIVTSFAGKMTWPASWTNGTLPSNDFDENDKIPTYALTSGSVTLAYVDDKGTPETTDDYTYPAATIPDIYDWSDDANSLKEQYTTQTGTATRSESIDMRSIDEIVNPTGVEWTGGDTNDGVFDIVANQYQKIRVYIWMEGQDPDCINYASLGGGLTVDIGLSKPEIGS